MARTAGYQTCGAARNNDAGTAAQKELALPNARNARLQNNDRLLDGERLQLAFLELRIDASEIGF
jgi:hypothetical protein